MAFVRRYFKDSSGVGRRSRQEVCGSEEYLRTTGCHPHGAGRMRRNFEPMRKQVEDWRQNQLTDEQGIIKVVSGNRVPYYPDSSSKVEYHPAMPSRVIEPTRVCYDFRHVRVGLYR